MRVRAPQEREWPAEALLLRIRRTRRLSAREANSSASMSPSTPNSTQGTRQVHTQGRKSDASGYVNWERQGEHGQPDDSDNEENVHSDTRLPKPLKVMPVLIATKMSLY
jgi:hypothetical protein